MLKKVNSWLRKFIFIFGAAAVIISLIPREKVNKRDSEIYPSKEFDDIW